MTVCIAAMCEEGRAIVSVSDRMISLGSFTSADSMTTKGIRVHANWATMFAAEDISSVDPVLRRVTVQVGSLRGTVDELLEAFRSGYQEEVRTQAEAKVLSKFGLGMKTFLQRGLKELGKETFADLCRRIETQELGLTLLVHGFEPNGCARIFTVESPGFTQEFRRTGFWAIGSGADSALSTLFFHRYNVGKTLNEAVYHCCEAKFMAETAGGVGTDTVLAVLQWNGPDQLQSGLFREVDLAPIRGAWEREGQPRVPKDVVDVVSQIIELGPIQPFTP